MLAHGALDGLDPGLDWTSSSSCPLRRARGGITRVSVISAGTNAVVAKEVARPSEVAAGTTETLTLDEYRARVRQRRARRAGR
jgi:hypothetical protein